MRYSRMHVCEGCGVRFECDECTDALYREDGAVWSRDHAPQRVSGESKKDWLCDKCLNLSDDAA